MYENEVEVSQHELAIRTGIQAGDGSQIGSGSAVGDNGQIGTGNAAGSQMGSGH